MTVLNWANNAIKFRVLRLCLEACMCAHDRAHKWYVLEL